MEKPNYFMHRINGGKNAFEISHKLLESGYLSIGWSDFSSQQFVQDVMKNGISASIRTLGFVKKPLVLVAFLKRDAEW